MVGGEERDPVLGYVHMIDPVTVDIEYTNSLVTTIILPDVYSASPTTVVTPREGEANPPRAEPVLV